MPYKTGSATLANRVYLENAEKRSEGFKLSPAVPEEE
jgi:hypothetical protein